MFKKLLLVSLLFVGATTARAQSLKITNVDADEPRLLNTMSNFMLGKSMTLTFFDRSVRVQLPGEKPLVLRKDGDNSFSTVEERGTGSEKLTFTLNTETTLTVVTAAIYRMRISENKSPYRSATLTITGKRF
jgi:hypothetical protein